MSSPSYSATVEGAVPGELAQEPRHEVMDRQSTSKISKCSLVKRLSGALCWKKWKTFSGGEKTSQEGGRRKLVGVMVNKGDPPKWGLNKRALVQKGEWKMQKSLSSYFIYYIVLKSETPLCKQNQFCQ